VTGPAASGAPRSQEWAACGASATGSEHIRRGLGCDDAYGYVVAGDFVAAVVADGAGSVTGTSAWGSYAACQSVLHRVTTPRFIGHFRSATAAEADQMMRWLFTCALKGVTKQADALGMPLTQLATTLCVAVATPELAVFGQIGDGVIASERDDVITTHLIEEKDEYANTTWFLQTDGAFEQAFRTSAHPGLTAFALSTDGMSYKITNIVTGQAYEPFFTGSWQHVRSGAGASDFAALLRSIEDDQTGDDKTMVLAALRWVDDKFHPWARPVQMTVTSSPPPADIPGAAAAFAQPVAAPTDVPSAKPQSIVDRASNGQGGAAVPPEDSAVQGKTQRSGRPRVRRQPTGSS
jgi:hypothetical protein